MRVLCALAAPDKLCNVTVYISHVNCLCTMMAPLTSHACAMQCRAAASTACVSAPKRAPSLMEKLTSTRSARAYKRCRHRAALKMLASGAGGVKAFKSKMYGRRLWYSAHVQRRAIDHEQFVDMCSSMPRFTKATCVALFVHPILQANCKGKWPYVISMPRCADSSSRPANNLSACGSHLGNRRRLKHGARQAENTIPMAADRRVVA